MNTSAHFGRVIQSTSSGSSDGSYLVPEGCFVLFEITCIRTTSSGFGTTVTVDGTTRNSYSSFPSSTDWASDFTMATAGQTISWTFTATASTKYYRILTIYKATPP